MFFKNLFKNISFLSLLSMLFFVNINCMDSKTKPIDIKRAKTYESDEFTELRHEFKKEKKKLLDEAKKHFEKHSEKHMPYNGHRKNENEQEETMDQKTREKFTQPTKQNLFSKKQIREYFAVCFKDLTEDAILELTKKNKKSCLKNKEDQKNIPPKTPLKKLTRGYLMYQERYRDKYPDRVNLINTDKKPLFTSEVEILVFPSENTSHVNIENAQSVHITSAQHVNIENAQTVKVTNATDVNIENAQEVKTTNATDVIVENAQEVEATNATDLNVERAKSVDIVYLSDEVLDNKFPPVSRFDVKTNKKNISSEKLKYPSRKSTQNKKSTNVGYSKSFTE